MAQHVGCEVDARTVAGSLNERRRPSRTAPRHYSFGSTAAVVTSVGLIVGFGTATVSRATIVSGLVIIALHHRRT